MSETVWTGSYPRGDATKAELIDLLSALMRAQAESERRGREQHEAEMIEWRETIADRLLALIPVLEDPMYRWDFARDELGISRLRAPCWMPSEDFQRRLEDQLAALEALPDGVVPKPVRRAIGVGGDNIS